MSIFMVTFCSSKFVCPKYILYFRNKIDVTKYTEFPNEHYPKEQM